MIRVPVSHYLAHIAEQGAGATYLDGFVKTFSGGADELLGFFIDFANGVCGIDVAVIS